ncbi:MAG: phosphate ABC transporter substrate-binding protein [Anaerolineae bacterium]|nr:phosphate ABC transporter substrate-binding protein [Anaerolineae bacterium]
MFCLFLAVALASACKPTPSPTLPPEPVQLSISGSTAMEPLLAALAEAFEGKYAGVSISIQGVNSAFGIEQVRQRKVALGAVAVSPPQGVWAAPIALDGIALVVHPDNPLDDLTLAQIQVIFSGRQWHWNDVGYSLEDEIVVISREPGSGTRTLFDERVMQGLKVTPAAIVMPGSAAVVEYVASHPNAIGYVSRGHVSPAVKTVRIEGAAPELANITDSRYHLVQPFYLVALQEPTAGAARQFVDFCLSQEGQRIVAERYVPVRRQ